ncbi:MAG TPA: glycoside hydrolase family 6 protein [Jatrophihabitans sp.]
MRTQLQPRRGRLAMRAVLAVLALLVVAAATSVPSGATTTHTGPASANPLAAAPWGVNTGRSEGIYPAWQEATGTTKQLLARIALRPRVHWFGAWTPTSDIAGLVRAYISQTQAGNANALVQLAVFRVYPGGERAKSVPLTAAAQADYKAWVDQVAAAIGTARVALILEPDLALALHGWRPAVRLGLVSYAARVFSALQRTSVYIDASAADWLQVPTAASMLRSAGVAHVRGFALNATHYDSTAAQVTFGRQIVAALTNAGIPNRHFVVNTADTGRPFTWPQYWVKHPHGNFNNAEVCRNRTEQRCVTLGIPPTTDVGNSAWHLPATVAAAAHKWCDGYLWFGRPWLDNQAAPFDRQRALAVAATTPYH